MVVPKEDVESFVQLRGIREFLVGVSCEQPGDCGIESRGVAHLAIEVTCRKRAGYGTDRARMRMSRSSDHRIPLHFRDHFSSRIHFWARNMAVHINTAGHDDVSSGIQSSIWTAAVTGRRYNFATLNPDVLHLTINAIRGIVNTSA